MPKKTPATVQRADTGGKFVVRDAKGSASEHSAGKDTPKVIKDAVSRNREALRRLADR